MSILFNKLLEDFYPINESLNPEVILNFPENRQVHNYDCGVSCLQSVLVYYGIEKREDELFKILNNKHTDISTNGIKIKDIIKIVKYYGLDIKIKNNCTIHDLIMNINNKIPIIILVQAYSNYPKNIDYKNDFKDGHYIVAIGYNDKNIFFEDPSLFNRGYISKEELIERWHAVDDNNIPTKEHIAIMILGKPVFDNNKIIHID